MMVLIYVEMMCKSTTIVKEDRSSISDEMSMCSEMWNLF